MPRKKEFIYCTFEGCEKPHSSKGLCKQHYNKMKLGFELKPITPQKKYPKLCAIENCNRSSFVKGFCTMHYKIQRREADKRTCSVSGCKNSYMAHGYCSTHNNRRLKGQPIENPMGIKIVRKKIHKECSIKNCTGLHASKGFCSKHYQAFKRARKIKESEPCNVLDCDRIAMVKGYCDMHYARILRHGTPHANYRGQHKKTAYSISNKPLSFDHSYEEVMILNEFFEESVGAEYLLHDE